MKHRGQVRLISMIRILVSVGVAFLGLSLVMVHRLQGFNDKMGHYSHLHTALSADRGASTTGDSHWPHPFIHILNTRFQQDQPNLTSLGRARLVLFETFCLNSIVGQTVLNKAKGIPFLWILKVDPELHEDLLRDLIALVKPYDFIYVVASNVNFGVGQRQGGWRGGEAGSDVLSSTLYTGDRTRLEQAHSARETRAVLETRIDADDGLHLEYVERLQHEASRTLRWDRDQSHQRTQRWLYLCSLRSLDWNPTPQNDNVDPHNQFGVFVARKSPHVCITPGITLGVSIGVQESELPRYGHFDLVQKLRYGGAKKAVQCGAATRSKCLHLLATPFIGAVRSRTPTSAGMRDVLLDDDRFEKRLHSLVTNNAALLTAVLRKDFHCRLDDVVRANRYVQAHAVDIAADNFRGQCTKGHSCKNSTKEALLSVIARSTKGEVDNV